MKMALMILGSATALTACSLFNGDARDGETTRAPKIEAHPHADAKFFVLYGPQGYLVDIRYIDIINESVIAIREAEDSTTPRETMTIPATVDVPSAEPYSSSGHRAVAVAIADHIRETAKICDDGRQMALRQTRDGATRATYRNERGAWVVFAACPGSLTS
ncbi:MAG: hypothetical protein AAGI13_13510 [Pseudomonadota bacterium]